MLKILLGLRLRVLWVNGFLWNTGAPLPVMHVRPTTHSLAQSGFNPQGRAPLLQVSISP